MRNAKDVLGELAVELLSSAGRVRFVARGGSMIPTILPGDALEISRLSFDAVRAGDVILAGDRVRLWAHRVLREEFRSGGRILITRGDALSAEDTPVSETEFLGRVDFVIRGQRVFRPEMDGLAPLFAALLRRSQRWLPVARSIYSAWHAVTRWGRTRLQLQPHISRRFVG